MRFMRRISIVELGECANAMLVKILIETFHQPFCPAKERFPGKLETNLCIWSKKRRPGAAIVVGLIPLSLRALIDRLVLAMPRRKRSYSSGSN